MLNRQFLSRRVAEYQKMIDASFKQISSKYRKLLKLFVIQLMIQFRKDFSSILQAPINYLFIFIMGPWILWRNIFCRRTLEMKCKKYVVFCFNYAYILYFFPFTMMITNILSLKYALISVLLWSLAICLEVEDPPQGIHCMSSFKQLFTALGASESEIDFLDSTRKKLDLEAQIFFVYKCCITKQQLQVTAVILRNQIRKMEQKYLNKFNNVVIGEGNNILGHKNVAIGNNITINGDGNYVFEDKTKDPYPIRGTGWVRTGDYDFNLGWADWVAYCPQCGFFPQKATKHYLELYKNLRNIYYQYYLAKRAH